MDGCWVVFPYFPPSCCDVTHPSGYESTGGYFPLFSEVVEGRDDSASRGFTDEPWDTVEDDVGTDTGDDAVCDVVSERDHDEG